MKVDRRRPAHWLLLLRQAACTVLIIVMRPFLARRATPVVVLYGHQFSGNLKALYRRWQSDGDSDLRLFFCALDPAIAEQAQRDAADVLRFSRLRDVVTLARTSVMITDHGLHLMSPLLRLTDIRFVDVWHGIPFKGFTPADFALQRRYHEVWVSSPLLRALYLDRFGFHPDKVRSLGYARVDRLLARPAPASRFRREGVPARDKVVLYAPTWQQDDQGRPLFPFGCGQEAFIRRLSEVCRANGAVLVIRAHLNASIRRDSHERVLYCSQKDFPDTEDVMLGSDILICDWSSIAFDFLALDRPTLFLDVPPPFRNGFSLGPEYRFGPVIDNLDALAASVERYLREPGAYFREYGKKHEATLEAVYGTDRREESARRQLRRLRELAG